MGCNLAGFRPPLPLSLLLLLLLLPPLPCSFSASEFSRADFPPDFVFGAGTSAYQAEGAIDEDGKGASIWDTFSHAGKIVGGANADVTADGYHHYKEDVKLMSETGLEGYRFSISWPRIFPNGRGAINRKGVEYYSNLLDELLNHGIEPHVTLYHLDLPQALEDEYGGWLSSEIVDDFVGFADVCFREFGDRVSHWTTFNEANILAVSAYDLGAFAPGRCSSPFGFVNCTAGNSTLEPYIVVHNVLLAHAAAVELYRTKYQSTQKGLIGINVYALGFHPRTNSTDDLEATARSIDFYIGWVLDPLTLGDYPERMKKIVGSKIPSITESQGNQLKGSIDFIALNYYTSAYVSNDPVPKKGPQDFSGDMSVLISCSSVYFFGLFLLVLCGLLVYLCAVSPFSNAASKDETPAGSFVPTSFPIDPVGLENFLLYLKGRYGNLPVYIHENGFGTPYNVTVNDTARIDAIKIYMGGILSSIRNGSTAKGYFVWSFLDVFELLTGYTTRFGLIYVDFEDKNRPRKPKLSALWYRDFLKETSQVLMADD